MLLTSDDIAAITGGRLAGRHDIVADDFATDSRNMFFTAGVAFVAITGKNHDGHSFLESLYDRGVRVFVVSNIPSSVEYFQDAAFIICSNTVTALQVLASWKRKQFRSTVIAITGSTGKTIVKEWLADILGISSAVVRSPKSYNSQIGVPLSVMKLEDKYDYGIFEAGISFPGEMENLQKVIDPDVGIITNIGDAHRENFNNDKEKATEKLKLFPNAGMIIFNADYHILSDLIRRDPGLKSKKLVDISFYDQGAAVYVRKMVSDNGWTNTEIVFSGTIMECSIPFIDRASVENAITVAAACFALGIDYNIIREGLASLVSVAMRMEVKSGINNCQLIEDYYNSDPGSLEMALEYLNKRVNNRKAVLILSDFIQSGRKEKDLYTEVATLVRRNGIDKFVGIGEALCRNRDLFDMSSVFYNSTDEFLIRLSGGDMFSDEVILLKGARIFEFEKIGRLLEQQIHTTTLEINLDAISHNINEFRRYLDPSTRLMAMVKAFAYGAGSSEIASLLEFHRVSYLAVANTDEGVELRKAGITIPVMVMNPDPSSCDQLIRFNLEPEIYSFVSLERFVNTASKHGLMYYPVHIKIDTGMHRLGFMPDEIDRLSERISRFDCIRIMSVFSHLSGSDIPALDKFTHRQAGIYSAAASKISNVLGYSFLRHILNTSGIIRFPQYQFDMVRPGIGIYGAGHYEGIKLKPAGRFVTRISQIKRIPAGEPVGYGCRDISDNERIIAILPVGYADGLNRKLGNNNGNLFIDGRRRSIIGNVCMDLCMADITGTGAAEGDEAEIFGENISINEIAEQCGTIPYEILTSIPGRVKRIFFRE